MIFITVMRFSWMAECRNTVREICSTFNVSRAVAQDMQQLIATGASAADCNAIATQAYMLCNQVGA